MLVKTEDRTLTTIGAQETAQFTIAPNGKAFRVLIDSIYSNKIRAIIRELCTNAYDSHVAAGIADRPFDLAIPTLMEPSFRVRDYGVSMTHEEVMGLYSTLFESSKDQDNIAVGKFGLGSKTPFAYTDTFTVTAHEGRTTRVYVANLRPDGVPQISLLSQEERTEEMGLEVSFPVEIKDINEFRDEALEVVPGFEVRPRDVNNSHAWEEKGEEPIMSGHRWKLMPRKDYYVHEAFKVRMGCVMYPLAPAELWGLDDIERAISTSNIVLDVPIGEIDITASRDGISYDEETRENLTTRVKQITREITTTMQAKISACANLQEATILYNEMIISLDDRFGGLYRVLQRLKYRGRKLTKQIGVERHHEKHVKRYLCMLGANETVHGRSTRSRQWSGKWEEGRLLAYKPGEVRFYVQDPLDKVSYPGVRIREDFKAFSSQGNKVGSMVWIKCNPKSRAFKRVLVALGRPDPSTFINVADLDAPKIARKGGAAKVMCKELRGAVRQDIEVNTDDENIVYIELHRQDFVGMNHNWSDNDLSAIWAAMKTAGEVSVDDKLVLVPKTHANKIKKAKKWRKFDTVAKIYVRKALDGKSRTHRDQFMKLDDELSKNYTYNRVWTFVKSCAENGDLPHKHHPFRDAIAKVRVLLRNMRRDSPDPNVERYYRYLYGAAPLIKVEGDPLIGARDMASRLEGMGQEYPLIGSCVSGYSNNVDRELRKNLLSYIDAMDKAA